MDDPLEDIFLNINPIKIMAKLNVGTNTKEYVPFKYDMLHFESKDIVKDVDSDYPYFTSSVKYPYDLLFNKDYVYLLEFFFNSKKFEKVLMKNIVDYVDENAIYSTRITEDIEDKNMDDETAQLMATLASNAEYNINAMMSLLFPIKYTFDNALSNTYRHYLLGEFNPNMLAFDPKRPFWEGNTGMMKIDGNVYVISNVIWVNDIVNHPVYLDFLVKYNKNLKTRRGLSSKIIAIDREKIMELMVLLFTLYYPKVKAQQGAQSAPVTNFFEQLKEAFDQETPSSSGNRYISNTLANKQQTLNILKEKIDYFLGENPLPRKIIDDVKENNKLNKTLVFQKIYESEQIIADIVAHITRMYNVFYETNKTDARISISSELNTNLTKLYNACIAIKATKVVLNFVMGEIRQIDMSEKNKDDTLKSKEERDVIGYIGKNYGSFAKLSDGITKSLENVIPPKRETSNILLRRELNKMRFKTSEEDDPPKLGEVPSCSRRSDFFRDVYSRYVMNRSQMPVNTELMYTGVNTMNAEYVAETKDGNTTNEIHVIIDLIDKAQYESGKYKCRLNDDIITNEFNHLLYSKMVNLVNPYRTYDTYNASFTASADEPDAKDEKRSTTTKGGQLLFEILENKKQHFNSIGRPRKSISNHNTRKRKNRKNGARKSMKKI